MDTIFYAKSTGGFYRSSIHKGAIPRDAVEVAQELYDRLMAAQATGKVIVADTAGNPQAIDRVITEAEKQAALVAAARAALAASDTTVIRCYEAGTPVPAAWASYRKGLREYLGGRAKAIPTKPEYPTGS